MKALTITAYVVLGALLIPPILFFAFYFAAGGPAADKGHPPAIIIPYVYVLLGLRFVAPVGMLVSLAAAGLAVSRAMPFWMRFRMLLLALLFGAGSVFAWLHQLR